MGLKLYNLYNMNLFGLCFIVIGTCLAGAYSQKFAKDLTAQEDGVMFRESGKRKNIPIVVDETTSLTEDQSGLELFENLVRDLFDDEDAPLQGSNTGEARTFGVKRLQFMLMPMMYKMGVMMTLLVVLTVISLKTFGIGVILLVLKLATFFGKFYAQGNVPSHGWPSPPQPVHVHLHNAGGGNHHHPANNGWESASGYGDADHYYYKS